ncbi:MAG: autophagy protein 5 [Trizodia sp. TS-e1964]|nr:MAG: autophagy protein 5 [Trizodia sp. TS-e1964]
MSTSECRNYDQADPYMIQYPRLSYLPFLLKRLHLFFAYSLIDPDVPLENGWFSFEGVPLKWHYPVGLLYDLFSGADPLQQKDNSLPWRLTLHFSDFPEDQLVQLDRDGRVMHDAYINSVKEADFLRNGSAKGIMSLSKDDSTKLWEAVQQHDLLLFNSVNEKLLNPPGVKLRHIPLKIYLPSSAEGILKVVQSLVTPSVSSEFYS